MNEPMGHWPMENTGALVWPGIEGSSTLDGGQSRRCWTEGPENGRGSWKLLDGQPAFKDHKATSMANGPRLP